MKWKPLVASLIVIAVALGAMAAWKGLSGPGKDAANTPKPNGPATACGGPVYIDEPLEDLPALDPSGLWPRHNQRMAASFVWITWLTTSHTKCRLLGTSNHRDWYVIGHTAGEKHYLQVDLGAFDPALTFAVEFDAAGKRYRSAPRTVFFGQGASFGQRRYKFRLGSEATQSWNLELTGRDATELTQESFLTTMFTPDDLTTYAIATAADTVKFGLDNADAVKMGTAGFLEVYDPRGDTYDRVLMELTR